MNYLRIYNEFIADRRTKEHLLKDDESERHHAEPVCRWPKGKPGRDAPENLIRLSFADHLFAHMLLAKIYGGELWRPIYFMVSDRKPRGRKTRAWFDMAKRQAVAAQKAEAALMTPEELRKRPCTVKVLQQIAEMTPEERSARMAPAVAAATAIKKVQYAQMTAEERKKTPQILAMQAARDAKWSGLTPEERKKDPSVAGMLSQLAGLTKEQRVERMAPAVAAASIARKARAEERRASKELL